MLIRISLALSLLSNYNIQFAVNSDISGIMMLLTLTNVNINCCHTENVEEE